MIEIDRTFNENGRIETAFGKCECGWEINFLDSDCYGTVECERCGRLYNPSGQSLLPRNQWEETLDEDY